jgi:hypothetical protein
MPTRVARIGTKAKACNYSTVYFFDDFVQFLKETDFFLPGFFFGQDLRPSVESLLAAAAFWAAAAWGDDLVTVSVLFLLRAL